MQYETEVGEFEQKRVPRTFSHPMGYDIDHLMVHGSMRVRFMSKERSTDLFIDYGLFREL